MRELLGQLYIKRILKYALFLFLALVAQNMLFTQLKIFGERPLVLPAVAVAVGMFARPGEAVAFSLLMGIFADMAFIENTVLFSVLFPAIAFGSGFAAQFFINRRFFAFMLMALAAELFTAAVQMLFAWVGSGAWSNELLKTVVVQALWSMPFAVLAYFPPAKWIE